MRVASVAEGGSISANSFRVCSVFLVLFFLIPSRLVLAGVKQQYTIENDYTYLWHLDGTFYYSYDEAYRDSIPPYIPDPETCSFDTTVKYFTDAVYGANSGLVNEWALRFPIHCNSNTYNSSGGKYVSLLSCKSGFYFDNATHSCLSGIDPSPECPGQGKDWLDPTKCAFIINQKNAGIPNQPCPNCVKGNPINVGTGNKFQEEADYDSPVEGGLHFHRYYNSQGDSAPRIGLNWFADYWQRLQILPPGDLTVVARRQDGKDIRFNRIIGTRQWQGDPDRVETLQELIDGQGNRTGWRLKLADDSVEEYRDVVTFAIPISITDRQGRVTTIISDLSQAEGGDVSPNTPDIVTDPFGRKLRFFYEPTGNVHLIKMIDPDGKEYLYNHDATRNLTAVIYPDATPGDQNDNPDRRYHYENINFPNHLTGITDENGNRIATYAYDSQGRAILSEHAGGADRITVTYNPDGTSSVMDSLGNTQTYTFESHYGVLSVTNVTGPCASCGQYAHATYDSNGFLTTRTDFNGNTTTFVRDARGLELSRTEAAGTPDARTITTTWHATFHLPLTITEPGKRTTFTYDSHGQLLTRQEETLP